MTTIGALRPAAIAAPSLLKLSIATRSPGGSHDPSTVTLSTEARAAAKQPSGSIAAGVAATALGAGMIAAASIGLPGIGAVAPGLLNGALRFLGLVACGGGVGQIARGCDHNSVRGTLVAAAGVGGMLAAVPVGGLTGLILGVGGFFTAWGGLDQMTR